MARQRAFVWILILIGLFTLEVHASHLRRQSRVSGSNSTTTTVTKRRTTPTNPTSVAPAKIVEKPLIQSQSSNVNTTSVLSAQPSEKSVTKRRRHQRRRKTKKHHLPLTTQLPSNYTEAEKAEPVEEEKEEIPPHYFTFSKRSSYSARLGADPVFSSSENYHLYPTYDDYQSSNSNDGKPAAKEVDQQAGSSSDKKVAQVNPQRRCQTIQKAMPYEKSGGHYKMMTCYVCGNRNDPYNNGGYTENCNFNPVDQVAASPTTSHGDKVYAGKEHAPYLNYQIPQKKSSHSSNQNYDQPQQHYGNQQYDNYGDAGQGYEEPSGNAEQTEKSSCKITYKGKMKCKVCGKGGAFSEQCDYEADDPGHHGQKSYDYSSANEKNYQSPKNGHGGSGGGGGHGGSGGDGHGGSGGGGDYGGNGGGDYGGSGGNYGGNGGYGGGGYGGYDPYGGYGGGGSYGGYPDYGGYGSGSKSSGSRYSEPSYESLCKNPFFSYSYGCYNSDDYGGSGGGSSGRGGHSGDGGKAKSHDDDHYKGSSDTRHDYSGGNDEKVAAAPNTHVADNGNGGGGSKAKKNCKIVYKDFDAYTPYDDGKKEKKDKSKPKMKCEVCVRSDGYGGVTEECNYTGGGEVTGVYPGAGDLSAYFGSPYDKDNDKFYSGNYDDHFRDAFY